MKPTIEQTILVHQRVGKALSMLEARMADLGITEFLDELHDVRDDYDRMADSLSQGQRDPSGGKLYASLLKRTYRLYNNVRLSSIIRKYPVLTYCRKAAEKTVGEGDVASVKASLEGFVQDLAMQTLFSGDSQEAAIAGIYAKHQRYMDALFGHILVSWQWTSKMRTEYAELLASPTVDQNDGMLIVSGVTLSLMQVYDVNKWMLLHDVYMNNPSQQLRQRALVGMVLTVPDMRSEKLFGEVENAITGMMEDADRRKELLFGKCQDGQQRDTTRHSSCAQQGESVGHHEERNSGEGRCYHRRHPQFGGSRPIYKGDRGQDVQDYGHAEEG